MLSISEISRADGARVDFCDATSNRERGSVSLTTDVLRVMAQDEKTRTQYEFPFTVAFGVGARLFGHAYREMRSLDRSR